MGEEGASLLGSDSIRIIGGLYSEKEYIQCFDGMELYGKGQKSQVMVTAFLEPIQEHQRARRRYSQEFLDRRIFEEAASHPATQKRRWTNG